MSTIGCNTNLLTGYLTGAAHLFNIVAKLLFYFNSCSLYKNIYNFAIRCPKATHKNTTNNYIIWKWKNFLANFHPLPPNYGRKR